MDRSREPNVVFVLNILLYAALAVFGVLGACAIPAARHDLALSRLATMYSLTEYGSFYLDAPEGREPNPFASNTVDKVLARGREISSKPPILPLMMTGEYVVLRSVFGLDLKNEADRGKVMRVLTFTFVWVPFFLTVLLFDRTVALFDVDPLIRWIVTLFLAFGTQLWGYSLSINNHIPGTFFLVLCLYLALGLIYRKWAPAPWRFALFGLSAGLVLTVEMPASIWAAIAGFCLMYHFPRKTLGWAALAVAAPVAVHAGVMMHVTGSPFPVQVHPDKYLFGNSYWRHPTGTDGRNEP